MSVNLSVRIVVEGYQPACEKAVVTAVRKVLEKESLDREFSPVTARKAPRGPRRISTRTPGAVVVAGASHWEPYFLGELEKAVAEANGGPCPVQLEVVDVDLKAAWEQESKDTADRRKALAAPAGSVSVRVEGRLGFDTPEALDEACEILARATGSSPDADREQLCVSGTWKFQGPRPKLDMAPMHWLRDLALAASSATTGQLLVHLPRKLELAVHRGGHVSVVSTSSEPLSSWWGLGYRSLSRLGTSVRQRGSTQIETFEISRDGTLGAVAVSFYEQGRGSHGLCDPCVVLADPRTGSQSDRLCGHQDRAAAIAFSSSGRLLALGSVPVDPHPVKLFVWEVNSGRLEAQATAKLHEALLPVNSDGFKRRKSLLLALCARADDGWLSAGGHHVGLWSPTLDLQHAVEVPGELLSTAFVLPDGVRFCTLNTKFRLAFWSSDPPRILLEHPHDVVAWALGPSFLVLAERAPDQALEDRRGRALPSDDVAYRKVLRAVDPNTLETLWAVDVKGNPRSLAFSPDGTEILGACIEQRHLLVRRWSAADGSRLKGVGGSQTEVVDGVGRIRCIDGRAMWGTRVLHDWTEDGRGPQSVTTA